MNCGLFDKTFSVHEMMNFENRTFFENFELFKKLKNNMFLTWFLFSFIYLEKSVNFSKPPQYHNWNCFFNLFLYIHLRGAGKVKHPTSLMLYVLERIRLSDLNNIMCLYLHYLPLPTGLGLLVVNNFSSGETILPDPNDYKPAFNQSNHTDRHSC